MTKLLLAVTLLFAVNVLYSQDSESVTSGKTIVTPDDKYLSQIHEVYSEDRLANDPELEKQLLILLKERVHLTYDPDMPAEKCPLISTVGLHNKYNASITEVDPVTFSADTFNPLIYNWNYFSENYQTFRIDGTGYVLVIRPQTPQKL